MAASFSVNSGKATVTFTYTAGTQQVIDTATKAAKWFRRNPIKTITAPADPDAMTNQELLNELDNWILEMIRQAAHLQNIIDAETTARAAAEAEAPGKFI